MEGEDQVGVVTGLAWTEVVIALAENNCLHRLAREICQFALKIPYPRFARVVADQIAERRVGDRPLVLLQAMRFDLLGQ